MFICTNGVTLFSGMPKCLLSRKKQIHMRKIIYFLTFLKPVPQIFHDRIDKTEPPLLLRSIDTEVILKFHAGA